MKVSKLDTFAGHRDCVYTIEAAHISNAILSAGADGQVVLWYFDKPDLGELVVQVPASIYAIALQPDSNTLWVGQNNDGVHLIDLQEKKEIKSLKLTNGSIFDIVFFDDMAYIATADGSVLVIDIENFGIKKSIKLSQKSIRRLQVDQKRKKLIAASSDGYLYWIDLVNNIPLLAIEAHVNSIFCIRIDPMRDVLISGSRDAHLKVWNLDSQQLMQDIVAHMYAINDVYFSPDLQYFASCSMDKSIKIWDAETYRLLKVVDKARHAGHGTSINRLHWHHNSELLLSASDDRMLALWQIER